MRSHDKFLIFLDANLETRFSRRETLSSKVSRIENRVSSLQDRDASDCQLTSERYRASKKQNRTATKVKTLLKKLFRVNFSNHFSISLPIVAEFSLNWISTTISKFRTRKKNCTSYAVAIIPRLKRFHVVVVLGRQRNEPNSVMRVQNCCYAYKNLPTLLFYFFLDVRVAATITHLKLTVFLAEVVAFLRGIF